jgi:hypothetical protein
LLWTPKLQQENLHCPCPHWFTRLHSTHFSLYELPFVLHPAQHLPRQIGRPRRATHAGECVAKAAAELNQGLTPTDLQSLLPVLVHLVVGFLVPSKGNRQVEWIGSHNSSYASISSAMSRQFRKAGLGSRVAGVRHPEHPSAYKPKPAHLRAVVEPLREKGKLTRAGNVPFSQGRRGRSIRHSAQSNQGFHLATETASLQVLTSTPDESVTA